MAVGILAILFSTFIGVCRITLGTKFLNGMTHSGLQSGFFYRLDTILCGPVRLGHGRCQHIQRSIVKTAAKSASRLSMLPDRRQTCCRWVKFSFLDNTKNGHKRSAPCVFWPNYRDATGVVWRGALEADGRSQALLRVNGAKFNTRSPPVCHQFCVGSSPLCSGRSSREMEK